MLCGLTQDVEYGAVTLTSNPNNCSYETWQKASQNCYVYSLNALWIFMQKYEWLWGIIFIGIGFFLGLFGKKLFSATMFIVGMLATIATIMIIFYTTFLSSKT